MALVLTIDMIGRALVFVRPDGGLKRLVPGHRRFPGCVTPGGIYIRPTDR